MPETYPDDAALLALSLDETTGVEYIPTGQSPYVMAYRRMLYRLLRSAERANDLRVYPMGGRMVGVRSGRCFVGDQPRTVAEPSPIELAADATTHVYINAAGEVVTSTTGLPADRSTFIPLAQAVTGASELSTLTDLRGEALLQAQSAALAGITATSTEINQALDGVAPQVTANNLSLLTAGYDSTADAQHRHLSTGQDVDGPATVTFTNLSSDAAATIGLDLSLPSVLSGVTRLEVDRATGFFTQAHLLASYHFVGATHLSWAHPGPFTNSVTGQLAGSIPIAGEVVGLILSCATNTQSSDNADGLSLSAYINGVALTTAPSTLTSADGLGFRSTDQGDGTPPTLTAGGVQDVSRGDLITIDLTYAANGTVTQAPTDLAILVVIKADRPI